MSSTLTLESPLDMHIHLREGAMLEAVARYHAPFSGGVVMPNLADIIDTVDKALAYKEQIRALLPDFTPFMTIYLTEGLTPSELRRAKKSGIGIIKLYPKGATTNSEAGVGEVLSLRMLELLGAMEELGLILSIHCESGGASSEREVGFHPVLEYICANYKGLRVIMEHMSDARSIPLLARYENLYATITLHHMVLNIEDLLGGPLHPHYFCKPVLKRESDMIALRELAMSGHKKVSFGSDSAPHPLEKKLSASGAAGVFSAPYLLEALASLFASYDALDRLQGFVSSHAIANYNLKGCFTKKLVHLVHSPCKVIDLVSYKGIRVVPFNAGATLEYSRLADR